MFHQSKMGIPARVVKLSIRHKCDGLAIIGTPRWRYVCMLPEPDASILADGMLRVCELPLPENRFKDPQ